MAEMYLRVRGALRFAQRLSLLVFILTLGFSGAVSATLVSRGPNMVYDTVLDITWTRQAGDGVLRNWVDANAWAGSLVFGGFDDWRLPYASVSAGVGPIMTAAIYRCTGAGGADEGACRNNEMGYMFYYNLDGNFPFPETGTQTAVGGEMLSGIQVVYWSGTQFNSVDAWNFRFDIGDNTPLPKGAAGFTWAVRPGDVAATSVSEPMSLLLFGVGALGLAFNRRTVRWRDRSVIR